MQDEEASWSNLHAFYLTLVFGYLVETLQRVVGYNLERRNKAFKARNASWRKSLNRTSALVYLYLIQCWLSILTCIFAIRKMYTREVPGWMMAMENVFALYFTAFHLLKAFLENFKLSKLVAVTNVLDMVTIASLLAQNFNDGYWLSFSYLQAAQSYVSFARVERHFGVLARLLRSTVGAAVVNTLAGTVSFIICMAGSIFMLETLGDPEGWSDGIGPDTEQYTMLNYCYLTVATITTVGYGDVTPKTALGQAAIMLSIVSGIVFFSAQAERLTEIMRLKSKGARRYYPPIDARSFLICGGAVRADSSLIQHFCHECLSDDHLESTDIQLVFISRTALHELADIYALTRSLRFRDVLTYVNGSPMLAQDMFNAGARSAEALFVLADPDAREPRREDLRNILRALESKRRFPNLDIHLLLLQSQSRQQCDVMGVDVASVVVLEDLKANMLAAAVHCPSLSTMVSNLVGSVNVEVDTDQLSPWMQEYLAGAELEIYRIEVPDNVRHLFFAEAAAHIFCGCGVTLIAAERLGQLYLNPCKSPLRVFESIYVIADDESQARRVADISIESSSDAGSLFELVPQKTLKGRRRSLDISEVNVMELNEDGMPMPSPDRARAKAHKKQLKKGLDRSTSFRLAHGEGWKLTEEGRSYADILQHEPWRSDEVVQLRTTDQELQYVKSLRHHIFIVCGSASLLRPLLRTLRESLHMDDANARPTPIVCCLGALPTIGVLGDIARYDGVHLLLGDVNHVHGLIAYGINRAKTVLLVEVHDNAGNDRLLADLHSVFTVSSIFSNSEEPVFTLTEIAHDDNIRFFSTLDVVANVRHRTTAQASFRHHRSEVAVDLGEDLSDETDTSVLRMHPLYTSGRVFSMSCLGNLLAQAVYTPTLPHLVDLLLKPASEMPESASFVTQIRVPPDAIGRSYADLFKFLYRAELCVPLGLYRGRGTNGSLLPYLATSPDPHTEILPTDNVVVLLPVACTSPDSAVDSVLVDRRVTHGQFADSIDGAAIS